MPGKRLLVADDSLTIQKVIRLALSHEGYEIQAVSNGVEAMEQLMLFRPDVVLIDVSLPGKPATEVKALVNEKPELADVRFVLMSSAFEQIDEPAIASAGFHGRLTKPFDPAHLRKVLTDSLSAPALAPAPPRVEAAPAPVAAPSLELPPVELPKMEFWDPPAPVEVQPPAPLEIQSPPSIEIAPEAPAPNLEFHEPWDTEKSRPETPSTPAPEKAGGMDTDIRALTQSTLQLAGIEDFEWAVSEKAGKDSGPKSWDAEPSLPPLPNLIAGMVASRVAPPAPVTPISVAPEPEELPPLFEEPAEIEAPAPAAPARAPFEPIELPPVRVAAPAPAPAEVPAAAALPDPAFIESLVHEQVDAILSQVTRERLSEIAERVIRDEIHRLLGEGPK